MAKSGMNPKTLQYLMGHSNISVTMNVYTHLGLEDAVREVRKVNVEADEVLSEMKSEAEILDEDADNEMLYEDPDED